MNINGARLFGVALVYTFFGLLGYGISTLNIKNPIQRSTILTLQNGTSFIYNYTHYIPYSLSQIEILWAIYIFIITFVVLCVYYID